MNMQTVDNPKYVFVCGLGRSGTSVLARNVARLENCTGFKNTGALEDEGQFLQDVYPSDNVYGGAAAFGFDPRAHLTEQSPLFTLENALRLRQNWERYWDQSKGIRVEKTPGHLLKTRFLQAVFPNSYFIVVRRHPIPVSLANNQRWKVTFAPLHKLFDHWLHCYGYSLIKGFVADEERIREAGDISVISAAFYSRAAEVCAMSVRTPLQAKSYIKEQLRAHLPETVKVRIKHALGKMAVKDQAKATSS
jgi:hypothetical protein